MRKSTKNSQRNVQKIPYQRNALRKFSEKFSKELLKYSSVEFMQKFPGKFLEKQFDEYIKRFREVFLNKLSENRIEELLYNFKKSCWTSHEKMF